MRLRALLTRANLLLVVVAVLVVAGASQLRLERVSGDSMSPTLRDGRIVVMERISYRFRQPEMGDMLVVHLRPDDWFLASSTGSMYLKRVVGTPGDTVEVKDGRVFVNGRLLEKLYSTAGTASPVDPMLIPDDSYYLVGDNYASSTDSRKWGPVPANRIAGRVWFALW